MSHKDKMCVTLSKHRLLYITCMTFGPVNALPLLSLKHDIAIYIYSTLFISNVFHFLCPGHVKGKKKVMQIAYVVVLIV